MFHLRPAVAFGLGLLVQASAHGAQPITDRPSEGLYEHAVVAADHPLASEAGVEMLRRGGNVVDAAVATAFTLSVVRPYSSGIGGGGFMVIWDAEQKRAVALDYRERAPQKATREMFFGETGPDQPGTERSRTGHMAVAVPGHVAGLCFALAKYGSLDLKTVLRPAIRAAREGVPVDQHDREIQADVLKTFARNPEYRQRFRGLWEQYLNQGKPWQPGDRFHSPQARVLELIAQRGPQAFYSGPVAAALVAESRRGGGLLTLEDLAAMAPVEREPLRGTFDDLSILTMPPPSSGGIALLQTLNILAKYEGSHNAFRLERSGHNSPEYLHLTTEALKHAFADRAEFLGDADFVDVPVKRLISRKYAAQLAAKIDPTRTKPPEAYGRFLPAQDAGTSHFSIIDAKGNAVACTETINTVFGSFVVEPEYGIVLNNEMDDFTAVPGRPNAFGLLQSERNAVAPRKKPLSSMTPTIAVDAEGRAVLAVGASGGPRIISAILQVLLNVTRFGMNPAEAVSQKRIHHQWLPNTLYLEPPLVMSVGESLSQRGHSVEKSTSVGVSQAATRSAEGLRGASDLRKHGRAAGF